MEIGFIRRQLLKFITFLQENTLSLGDNTLYESLTALHFRLYFRKSLKGEAVYGSREFRAAAHRHAAMVVYSLYRDSENKELMYNVAMQSFQKNFLIKQSL